MTYTPHADHHRHSAAGMAFVESTAPYRAMGEAVYEGFDSFGSLVSRAVRAARAKIREHRTVRDLSGVGDDTLKDIGVHRSQIRHVARRAAANPGVNYRVFCQ